LKVSASKSATSPSCKTLAVSTLPPKTLNKKRLKYNQHENIHLLYYRYFTTMWHIYFWQNKQQAKSKRATLFNTIQQNNIKFKKINKMKLLFLIHILMLTNGWFFIEKIKNQAKKCIFIP
jgi:hypothetical protein